MLELKNIVYSVEDENNETKGILKDISLTIEDGKFIAVTGPNGGGKSTLAKIIAGIVKPQSGKIIWNGTDITDYDITMRAKAGISFAFQQPVRFKGITVKDLIKLAAGPDKKPSDINICDCLSEVGLCARDYINREVDGSLSGGELKRIEIASVLVRNTPLTVFDEPEAGIDLWSFNNLIKVFEKMREQKDKNIMIISHQERILEIADEIIVIADGQVTKRGSSEEIMPELLNTAGNCRYFRKEQ